jgi:hypothetical protein
MENNNRGVRFAGRSALRLVTQNSRCYDCGRESVQVGGQVGVRLTDGGVVGFAGLSSCGAAWLCPVCNAKVMAERADRPSQLLEQAG